MEVSWVIGYPQLSSTWIWIFHEITHLFWDTPMTMETPKSTSTTRENDKSCKCHCSQGVWSIHLVEAFAAGLLSQNTCLLRGWKTLCVTFLCGHCDPGCFSLTSKPYMFVVIHSHVSNNWSVIHHQKNNLLLGSLQGGAPKIAKLVHNSNNYGL